jgi:CHAD domain-containing protein
MSATNPLRELDVLLGSLTPCKYPKLSKQLLKLRKKMFTALFTPEFIEYIFSTMDEYATMLSEYHSNLILDSMKQKVLTHYHHCLNQYHTIKSDSPAKKLHRLRIDFKDARYGLEFLQRSGMVECEEMIHHCKQLQNILGELHDTLNQVQWLKKFQHKHPSLEAKKLLQKRKKFLKKMRKQISKNV